MKKVILALAIVSSVSFVACNSGEEKTEAPKTDSPAVAPAKVDSPAAPIKADSPAVAPAKVDSPKVEKK